jgi:hypothetical protein
LFYKPIFTKSDFFGLFFWFLFQHYFPHFSAMKNCPFLTSLFCLLVLGFVCFCWLAGCACKGKNTLP